MKAWQLVLFSLCLAILAGCGTSGATTARPTEATQKVVLTPDKDGFIPWADAKKLILDGEVVSVAQKHDRTVFLTMQDKTEYRTREDHLDEVIKLTEDNGLQKKISMATE